MVFGGAEWLSSHLQGFLQSLGVVSKHLQSFGKQGHFLKLPTLRRELGMPARLLGIGLPLAIVLGTLIVAGLLPGIGLAEAALVAVILAPTDPALGQAVVTNDAVPQPQVKHRLRWPPCCLGCLLPGSQS